MRPFNLNKVILTGVVCSDPLIGEATDNLYKVRFPLLCVQEKNSCFSLEPSETSKTSDSNETFTIFADLPLDSIPLKNQTLYVEGRLQLMRSLIEQTPKQWVIRAQLLTSIDPSTEHTLSPLPNLH